MVKRNAIIAVCLTVLLSSLLCLGLYRWDNKYTRADIQPISGMLFYSSDTDTELCYLTREWMLYPDVLLTPEEVQSYSGYRTYGDIGGKNDINKGSNGCITYRLTLILPEEVREYAIELPEIFSACRMYVNGRLAAELGDPSAESYSEGIGSRVVTFSASGATELLIAAADRSGVNFGMTYPPAFGSPEAVMAVREYRLLLHGGSALLALLGAVLSLTFGLRGGWKRGILTALLCIAAAVVTGYPLLHGMRVTAVQPWYTLEPICYYGLLLSALLLYTDIYELPLKKRLLIASPCMAGLILTLLRFGAASVPAETADVFSVISALLKYYTAFCLIILSAWALSGKKYRSVILLCGSAALTVCLIFDRLLPVYEPIIGGWFGEIGAIMPVFSLTAVLWIDASDAYRFRLQYEASFLQMEQRLAMQKEHYARLSEQIRLAREASHDLRHNMRILHKFAEAQDWTKLTDYLSEYASHITERELHLYSEHSAADAVLSYYAAAAKKLNVAYDVRFTVPHDLNFPDDELCILLSNLLENALEALEKQQHGSRRLYLRGDVADQKIRLVVDNTFNGIIHEKNGIFASTKRPGLGLGISSVNTIAEKHGGMTAFEVNGGEFHVSVCIPLPEITRIS